MVFGAAELALLDEDLLVPDELPEDVLPELLLELFGLSESDEAELLALPEAEELALLVPVALLVLDEEEAALLEAELFVFALSVAAASSSFSERSSFSAVWLWLSALVFEGAAVTGLVTISVDTSICVAP